MKRLVVGLILLAATFMAGCGPESAPGAGQPATSASKATSTVVGTATSQVAAVAATAPLAFALSPGATTAEPDLAQTPSPLPTPTVTSVPGDSIPMAVSPTSVPTPDVNKVTVPDLDDIVFVNPRLLPFPEELHGLLGSIHWSPDGSRYLGVLPEGTVNESGEFTGIVESIAGPPAIFIGDAEGTQFGVWRRNASSPAWSQDGKSIYYLSPDSTGAGSMYELYVQPVLPDDSVLVLQRVAMADTTRPSAAEAMNGQLLTYDSKGEVVLLRLGADESPTPLEASIGIEKRYQIGASFQVAPDGTLAALIPFGQETVFIVDLRTLEVSSIQTTGPVSVPRNLTWSSDSASIAYATPFGVFVHDLINDQTRTLVSREDLGFTQGNASNTPGDGFSSPVWSPNDEVVLFLAGTPSWAETGADSGNRMFFLFGATVEGGGWKALSHYVINGMTQDGSRLIATGWPPGSERSSGSSPTYLFDVVWGEVENGVH